MLSQAVTRCSHAISRNPHLCWAIAAEIDYVRRLNRRYFCTIQLFELGEWDWNIAKPGVSAISQPRSSKQTRSDEPK
jgi:hypothetical protein